MLYSCNSGVTIEIFSLLSGVYVSFYRGSFLVIALLMQCVKCEQKDTIKKDVKGLKTD